MTDTRIVGNNGTPVNVSADERLETSSINISRSSDISSRTGDTFIFSTDFISLTTTGSFNGVLYIKNIDANCHFHVERVRVSGGTSGSLQCKLIGTPTTGTLISEANAGNANPTNLASPKQATNRITVYSASGDGKTVTDGTHLTQWIVGTPDNSLQQYYGSFILEQNKALALVCKPSVAMDVGVEFYGYFEENV
jgi:hypothetical protein|tara:strand:- start:14416 stop:15000 length:585 start_codon:yes stop_codon:yes gene_type:complete